MGAPTRHAHGKKDSEHAAPWGCARARARVCACACVCLRACVCTEVGCKARLNHRRRDRRAVRGTRPRRPTWEREKPGGAATE